MEMFEKDKVYNDVLNLLYNPNIFSILKIESNEVRHTNMLEWLLSIDDYKGLKEIIKIWNKEKSINNFKIIDTNSIIIYNDIPFNQIFNNSDNNKRPDLLIKYKNIDDLEYHYILIENKINAFENEYENGKYQTKEYYEEMKKLNIEDVMYIFIDVKRNNPQCDEFINIDYDNLYNNILKKIKPNDIEERIYKEYIYSLRRPSFDKTDIELDTIYSIDVDDIKDYKEFFNSNKESIYNYINNYNDNLNESDREKYITLKYILYCIDNKSNIKIDDNILEKLDIISKRKNHKWKYNGICTTNIDLVKKLCKDLLDNNDKLFDKIKKLKSGSDKLIVYDLEKEKEEGWKNYLTKHPDKRIEDYYDAIDDNNNVYLRNYIGVDTMEEISNILKSDKCNDKYILEKVI